MSKLPLRSEIRKEDTWDLECIFKNEKEWEKALLKQSKKLKGVSKYQGKLYSIKNIQSCLNLVSNIERHLETIYVYATYMVATDMGSSKAQSMEAKVIQVFTDFSQSISFITPELLTKKDDFLRKCIHHKDLSDHVMTLKSIIRQRKHTLSEKEEKLLSRASILWGDTDDIFGKLSDVDIQFESVKDSKGKKHVLSHGRYALLLESYDRVLRKNAFEGVYKEYGQYSNTFANILYNKMKQHHFKSDIRGYKNTLDAALYTKAIDTSVYTNLIETVEKNLFLLHKYIKLRKKKLGLSSIHMWDLRVSLVENIEMKFTYEEAVDMVLKALEPLGKEYGKILKDALLKKRWVDKYENKGKRSGAFSGGGYDTYPYILLNFTGTLNDVYTLIHEAGHSMHSYMAKKHQPYDLHDYTIFTAEIASTLNERLLTDYLLKTLSGKERKYVISYEIDAIRATFFRQVQFAEFELLIHYLVEQGQALTAEVLNKEYKAINGKYYGADMGDDNCIQYEWARIPHFYYDYYVYQYATGIACAYRFADSILQGGKKECDKYLELLQSGGNDFPLIQLKKAGIDMHKPDVYEPLFKRFQFLVKELGSTR